MKKTVKSYTKYGKECGIASHVEGKTVEVWKSEKFPNLWEFEIAGQLWLASDYAFEKEE